MYNYEVLPMTKENTAFKEKWQQDKEKEHVRVTILKEAAEFVGERAYKDFGLGQSSISLEISKLLMIAKECLEKQEK